MNNEIYKIIVLSDLIDRRNFRKLLKIVELLSSNNLLFFKKLLEEAIKKEGADYLTSNKIAYYTIINKLQHTSRL